MKSVYDFRFAYLAIGFWLGALCSFAITTKSSHWVLAIFIFGFCFAYVSPKKKLFITTFLIGLLVTMARYHSLHQSDTQILMLSKTQFTFEITSDPILVSQSFGGELALEKDVFVFADIQYVEGSFPVALTIDEINPKLTSALPSSKWKCRMSLSLAPKNRRYIAFAKCLDSPVAISSESRMHNLAGGFRDALKRLTYQRVDSDAAALLPGLVLGDNRAQSDELVSNLRLSGLGHLTAVSGANVAILLLFVQFFLQKTRLSDNWRLVILLIVLALFVIVARPSPSVVRAAMMAAIALLYWIKGLQKLSEAVLFLAIFTLLFLDPWLALSWGFALSVAATLGLILFPRYWKVDANSSLVIKVVSTALAASLATLPILIAMGSVVTVATVPANMLAEILVAPATIFGLIAPVVSFIPILSSSAEFIANLAIGSAAVIVKIADFFANSFLNIEVLSLPGLLTIVVILFAYKMRSNRVLMFTFILLALVSQSLFLKIENRWKIQNWEIAVCDIGQGDATLVRTGLHSALVIDVGPDARMMKKCLKTFDIRKIDLFVASHFHADHVGAINGLVEIAIPRRVLTASLLSPNGGVELVDAAISPIQREIAVIGMNGRFTRPNFAVYWQVLAPVNSPQHVDDSNGSLINNNSVVLLVTTSHHRVLFTGDLEIDGQEKLMNEITNPNVDLVKVPHHGSVYQAPDFAAWLQPKLAWISAGLENPYGHPNPTTISLYRQSGAIVLTTSDCGHITIGPDNYATSKSCV